MNYAAIVREVHNRLSFHSRAGGMLDGLKLRTSGEYRIEGDGDLPHVLLVDLECQDSRGSGTGLLTLWLRTAQRHGWFRAEGEDPLHEKPLGLIDWQLLVMDAVETKPSDGLPDQLLIAHDSDGMVIPDLNDQGVELLSEPFSWQTNMAEITDLMFAMQLQLSFSLVTTKRAARRSVPAFKPVGAR